MKPNPIGWCDITINPIVGCSKCSPGCQNCYAERFAARLARNPQTAAKYRGVVDEHGKWTGRLSRLDMSCFDKLPKKPSRIFVGSMTDFFHENANFDDQGKVLSRIANTPQHTFIMLTKRPESVWRRYHTMLPNLWLGVTVCNQAEADAKIPILLKIPAAKRFISVEPTLGPVDLRLYLSLYGENGSCEFLEEHGWGYDNYSGGFIGSGKAGYDPIYDPQPGISWVICGGETGPGAREMAPDWPRSLRDQCVDAGVPFYFKGWGGKGKKAAPLLDGSEWHQFPMPEKALSKLLFASHNGSGLSLREISAQCGVLPHRLSEIENELDTPTPEEEAKIRKWMEAQNG